MMIMRSLAGGGRPSSHVAPLARACRCGHAADAACPNPTTRYSAVPAIWDDAAKGFMKECAAAAGMVESPDSDDLLIALEPECALLTAMSAVGPADAAAISAVGAATLVLDAGGEWWPCLPIDAAAAAPWMPPSWWLLQTGGVAMVVITALSCELMIASRLHHACTHPTLARACRRHVRLRERPSRGRKTDVPIFTRDRCRCVDSSPAPTAAWCAVLPQTHIAAMRCGLLQAATPRERWTWTRRSESSCTQSSVQTK